VKTLCLKCKGRNYCGKPCQWNKTISEKIDFKKEFFGTSPGVFIGHHNYPDLNIGILTPQFQTNKAREWDNPKMWSMKYSISDVIEKRRTLVNCNNKKSESLIEKVQLVALSRKPVDVEVNLDKAPKLKESFDFINNPLGPSAKAEKLLLCEDVKIKRVVEKYYYDTDLKSADAVNNLYNKGLDENEITRMFSTGAFGVQKNRKLVPTRWSITAVDDTLGKELISSVKNYPIIDNYRVLNGNFYGNYYTIILLPDVWGYELFETMNGDDYCHDCEDYNGRNEYAFNTAGGYYAARLAVLEYLNSVKKQARVIVLRQITNEYYCPLGVWVVKQATRKACSSVNCFNSKSGMMTHLGIITPLHELLRKSVLFENFNSQKRLSTYL